MQFNTTKFGIFRNTRRIGRGGQACIYLAHLDVNEYGQRPLVFKRFKEKKHHKNENTIIGKLGYHKNIIQVLDNGECIINKKPDSRILVYKYYNKGDGRDFTDNYNKQSIPDKCTAVETDFAAIWEAIAFAHSKGISHRDIKPENILVHQTNANKPSIVLTDWSFSSSDEILYGVKGSISYIPPEIGSQISSQIGSQIGSQIRKQNGTHYNYKCDIWSAGATWLSLCNGTNMLQYQHADNMKKYGYVYIKDKFPHIWENFTDTTQKILEHTIRVEPTERAEAHEIVSMLQAHA